MHARGTTRLSIAACLAALTTSPASADGPVIDVHRHVTWPGDDDAAYRGKVLEEMGRENVVLSLIHLTEPSDVQDWALQSPDRFIAGPMFPCPRNTTEPFYRCFPETQGWPDIDWLEREARAGRIGLLGEMLFVYAGVAPDDPRMRPYWALAAKHDLPVMVHINRGPPPGARNSLRGVPGCCPDFDGELGNPALLRPILDRHPGLRIVLFHAGMGNAPDHLPFPAETLALLRDYPSVYLDMSILNSVAPAEAHEAELKRFIDAGFGSRILLGSDNLPIALIKRRLEAIDWLSPQQRRAIYYDNAARFLRLSEERIAAHRSAAGISD